MPHSPEVRLAVLIDADNAQPAVSAAIFAEVAKLGRATVKRVYGDFTTQNLAGWKRAANEQSIQPCQQFGYTKGKNATDSALIIDAMDLLYSGNVDGFVLVSSDSDFTRLATRLRESGMTVYGVGEDKTPQAFVSACDRFISTEVLRTEEQAGTDAPVATGQPSTTLRGDTRLVMLCRAGIEAASDDNGWAHLGGVGSHIVKQSPDFDPRRWGYPKLSDLVEAIGLFEVRRMSSDDGRSTGVRVRDPRRS